MTRRGGWLVAVYVVLLLLSHGVRRWPRPPSPLPDDLRAVAVSPLAGERRLGGELRLAYREWRPPTPGATPVVLLLHGSPGSSRDFDTLGPALAKSWRTLAPDLPGFGHSSRAAPDYSIRAHAGYARQLLDRLGIEWAHVVGFSMGGGVALEMARQAPARVRSLTLLSAIGVQELELLGGYRLNHAVHGVQLALLWLAREGMPHFGALDDALLGVPYARNFYDSDQRPLRGVLERLQAPTLIVHGTDDPLVPAAVAREHHRIVPHSELLLFAADHFMVFRGGERLAAPIAGFIARVERGRAGDRAEADPQRLAAALQPFDPRTVPTATGVALLVLMALIAAATLVSEDLTCIAAGLLVAQGRLGFTAATAACFAGILVGDVLLFWAGRALGRPWLGRRPLRWLISPERVERSSRWFARRGPAVILLSRFLPGARLPTYVAAGVLRTSFWRFVGYFSLAVALWTPLLVGLAAVLGRRAFAYLELFERYALGGAVALAVATWLALRVARLLLTHRGRRLAAGWLCRWRRWEHWPPWLFYPPVVLRVLWLGLRHRAPTLFTAANPGMPAGGFIGESKSRILDRLEARWVARYRRIAAAAPPAARQAAVRGFLEEHALALPVVLKPDAGQRGDGVVVARTWAEVERYLEAAGRDVLVQEHVEGPELGIFYARLPDEERGRVFSITEKVLPEVTGDGVSTVERLILDDRRAVCLAPLYLARLAARLDQVPAAGERVRLTDLGTHCRGALFLDGSRFRTPPLEAVTEEISRPYAGFFFGRYDVRAPSEEALRQGRDLKVLELNGVTSEATHIYDPATRLLDAYRTLFRQWELAFEIGRQNRDRGARPTGVGELARLMIRHLRGAGAGHIGSPPADEP